ncbi:hypothetical protein GGTG_05631 [Gaeumannomyces tritici R3-111a-1]|uniref:Uncharacterized protein n=1 Tax=Gaeumannomyces tritici (strain R3-111a-1) TaxID=644352 RepID=J3NWG7_GAET3|nr:hypothetical protein GGTG_05631 [Gaeumannomyces tritici R3-111a-1]EJT75699.1 hypothetical protein GGTG_05631 [Gaeumannomyces tritici R3-111a-1]
MAQLFSRRRHLRAHTATTALAFIASMSQLSGRARARASPSSRNFQVQSPTRQVGFAGAQQVQLAPHQRRRRQAPVFHLAFVAADRWPTRALRPGRGNKPGKTLEEIAELFGDRVATKDVDKPSRPAQVAHIRGERSPGAAQGLAR